MRCGSEIETVTKINDDGIEEIEAYKVFLYEKMSSGKIIGKNKWKILANFLGNLDFNTVDGIYKGSHESSQ